jgi:branched-subunit amino acid transport protein AzlD
MLSLGEAIAYTFIMGGVIFFCRLFPFIFFSGSGGGGGFKEKFLAFIEKTAPPVAMTVLALREIASPLKEVFAGKAGAADFFAVAASGAVCVLLYILSKRNALVSILGSTVLYMACVFLAH